MRVLCLSDAGVPTGFGQVTTQIGDRLVRDFGHEVSVLASNWRGDHVDSPMRFYLPNQLVPSDIYGQSRFIELIGKVMPDVIWMLNDPAVIMAFMFNSPWDTERLLWSGFPVGDKVYRPPIVGYLPVDGYETPGAWNVLDSRMTRVAMSHFGQTAMPDAPVVWHGVDHDVFKPMDKRAAKKLLGYDPDRFLIVRADKQSIRKDYPSLWKALRPLLRKHDDIDVHWHCLPRASDGYDMNAVRFNDPDIRDRVNFSQNLTGFSGWGDAELAVLLAAADLYVTTSWGEGFGLLPLESLACGTPVVATDCSALTEVIGPGGLLVPPAGRITAPMGQEQCLPDVAGFTAAIESLYRSRSRRKALAAAGIAHAAQFSWDSTASQMEAILQQAVADAATPREAAVAVA